MAKLTGALLLLLLSSHGLLVTSQSPMPVAAQFTGLLFKANCEAAHVFNDNTHVLWMALDKELAIVTRDCYISGEVEGRETKIYRMRDGVFEPVGDLNEITSHVDISGSVAIGTPPRDLRLPADIPKYSDVLLYYEEDISGNWTKAQYLVVTEDDGEDNIGEIKSVAINGDVITTVIDRAWYGYDSEVKIHRRNESMVWQMEQNYTEHDFGLEPFGFGDKIYFNGRILALVGEADDSYYDNMGFYVDESPCAIVFLNYDEGAKSWMQSSEILKIHGTDCDDIALTEDDGFLCYSEISGFLYFKRSAESNSYVLQQNITVPDTLLFASDGKSVVLGTGSKVILFQRSNDVFLKAGTIEPPFTGNGQYFGFQMAISDDVLLVGSKYNLYSYVLTESEAALVGQVDQNHGSPSTSNTIPSSTSPEVSMENEMGSTIEGSTENPVPAQPNPFNELENNGGNAPLSKNIIGRLGFFIFMMVIVSQ
ncbi:hypothetical protein ACHAXS_000825 [Conticribra weissflogii]